MGLSTGVCQLGQPPAITCSNMLKQLLFKPGFPFKILVAGCSIKLVQILIQHLLVQILVASPTCCPETECTLPGAEVQRQKAIPAFALRQMPNPTLGEPRVKQPMAKMPGGSLDLQRAVGCSDVS